MKITKTKCPHCNKTINVTVEGGSGEVQDFGEPKIYLCKFCHGKISNGLSEWKELTPIEKIIAVFRTIYTSVFWSVSSGGIVAAIAMFYFDLSDRESLIVATLLVSFAFIVFSIIYFNNLLKEIRKSNARHCSSARK